MAISAPRHHRMGSLAEQQLVLSALEVGRRHPAPSSSALPLDCPATLLVSRIAPFRSIYQTGGRMGRQKRCCSFTSLFHPAATSTHCACLSSLHHQYALSALIGLGCLCMFEATNTIVRERSNVGQRLYLWAVRTGLQRHISAGESLLVHSSCTWFL